MNLLPPFLRLFFLLPLLIACSPETALEEELDTIAQENTITERPGDHLTVPVNISGKAIPKALFMGFAGTWCWACGDYGAKVILDVTSGIESTDDVLIIDSHVRDKLDSKVSRSFNDYWESISMPYFMVNGEKIDGYPTNFALQEILDFKLKSPEIGLIVNKEITSDSIFIESKLKFFEDVEGTYTYSAYVIDHGTIYPQKGKDGSTFPDLKFEDGTYPEFEHNHILRANTHENAFGEIIAEGEIKNGTTSYSKFQIPLDTTWSDNIDVHGIVWKKIGENYQFINAF